MSNGGGDLEVCPLHSKVVTFFESRLGVLWAKHFPLLYKNKYYLIQVLVITFRITGADDLEKTGNKYYLIYFYTPGAFPLLGKQVWLSKCYRLQGRKACVSRSWWDRW